MLTGRLRTQNLVRVIFGTEREAGAPWLARAWSAALFAAGIIGWSYVLGWGVTPLDFHDWTGINLPRLLFLQNALRAGEWPLHMAGTASLHGVTDRFLALPDVITSPQTILLLFMPVTRFVVVDVLIHYAAGFAGLVLLRRHFGWSLYTFALAFLLFLFNGHIVSHYGVGHFTWGAYFLFPFVALFLLRFLDGDTSWQSIAWFAALLFYMVLSGGEHHFAWVLLLLALLVPFCWRRAWWLFAVAVASGLLGAVRLLPPALELQSFRAAGLVADVIGYPSVSHLVMSLVFLRRETPAYNEALPGNIWFFDSAFYEFNAYIGAIGFAILVTGAYRWLRAASPIYPQLIVPVFLMMAFSLGSVYRIVRATAIPLLESERYTSRLFSLPLFLLIVMALTALDRWMKATAVSAWHRALALLALSCVAIDIGASLRLWRAAISSGMFGRTGFDAAASAVVERADPAYVNVLLAGAVVTVATAAILLALVYRERRARVHISSTATDA